MSDRSRTILARLNKVESRIFPPNSVAAKIKSLSPQDRAIFDRHRQECAMWTNARPGETAYAALLCGEPMPELPRYIHEKIYPAYQESLSGEENYQLLREAL